MKRIALAIASASFVLATIFIACTPDASEEFPVIPQSNAPLLGQAHQPPITAPDAQVCGSGSDSGGNGCGNSLPDGGLSDGGAFSRDAGMQPTDAGLTITDAQFP